MFFVASAFLLAPVVTRAADSAGSPAKTKTAPKASKKASKKKPAATDKTTSTKAAPRTLRPGALTVNVGHEINDDAHVTPFPSFAPHARKALAQNRRDQLIDAEEAARASKASDRWSTVLFHLRELDSRNDPEACFWRVVAFHGDVPQAYLDIVSKYEYKPDRGSMIGRTLVERILAFSRSGVGERVAVHVEAVVREALDLVAAKLPEGVTIEARLRAGRAAMLGDPTQVHQVLMNLATNAIQAMTSGGALRVSLDVERLDKPRIATTGTIATGEYVVLEVADCGTGIPKEIIEQIFDPFFSTKEIGVGTGLGLSLVHGIVTAIGGAIDVASTVGVGSVGSVFTVYLPRTGEAAEDGEAETLALPRGNREQILIVDDEEPLVRLATETLAELGYVPVGFTSSVAALEAFRVHPERFDAVITDERMPSMSGSGLIREVRGIRSEIPILLVTGYPGAAVVQRARDAGVDAVLGKPLLARELATSLARVLHLQ
jgi:signal transduction histidine kinase